MYPLFFGSLIRVIIDGSFLESIYKKKNYQFFFKDGQSTMFSHHLANTDRDETIINIFFFYKKTSRLQSKSNHNNCVLYYNNNNIIHT